MQPSPPRGADGAPSGVPVDGSLGAGAVPTGAFPYGGAYDPATDTVYVANQADNNVTAFNGTTGRHITDIAMTSDPLGAAYVSWNRLLYVIVEGSKSIEVVNTSTNTVNSTIPLSGDPEYIAYDPDNQELYASVWTSFTIPLGLQSVNTTSNHASPAITAGFDAPYCLTVDPTNDTVWVENLNNDSITVLGGEHDTVVRWVHPGPQPSSATLTGGIAYSPVGDQIFIVNYASVGTVNAIGASNYSLIRSGIPVGAYAYGASATFDPASESLYVASFDTNTTTVISAVNDTVSEPTLTMLGGPWVGIFDSSTGALFFLLSETNAAAWIFGGIAASFSETGLAPGSPWTVTLNGTAQTSRSATLDFAEAVGELAYSVTPVNGFYLAHATGVIDIPSSPVTPLVLSFAFEVPYSVLFMESGLPLGSTWDVQLGGLWMNQTAGTAAAFSDPNGDYPFTVSSSAADYTPLANGSGTASVDDHALEISVPFGLVEYPVNFSENGLPPGTSWWVNVTGGASTQSLNPTLSFAEPNGSYDYAIATANKSYDSRGGTLEVRGAPVPETVTFTLVGYRVNFLEAGLPGATSWSVTLGDATQSGTGTITFSGIANGSMTYEVGNLTGYRPTPESGAILVAGHPSNVTILFTGSPPSISGGGSEAPTILGLPALVGYGLIAAIILVLILVIALRWSRRARPPGTPPIAP